VFVHKSRGGDLADPRPKGEVGTQRRNLGAEADMVLRRDHRHRNTGITRAGELHLRSVDVIDPDHRVSRN
jgi:hypothetical protein